MHPVRDRFSRSLRCAVLALAAAPFLVLAQPFPSKSVRMVVPFAAGGTADVLGRLIAQRLSPLYGHQMVVDNRPGSGGHVGAEAAARAAPDGHTVVLGTIGIHAAYGIYSKLAYDPAKDLQPVILLGEVPCVLVLNPSVPIRSVQEFIAFAKARPGELNFGSAGTGSSTHMTGELFKLMAGIELTHVPYKGSAPALTDLMGGQIQAMFENLPTLPQLIATGKVRALAVTSKTRSPALPDVPTVAESGLPDYASTAWFTVAAPGKTPPAVIRKLNADIDAMLHAPDLQPRLRELGLTVIGGTPEAASSYFAQETAKWNAVIKTARIRAD